MRNGRPSASHFGIVMLLFLAIGPRLSAMQSNVSVRLLFQIAESDVQQLGIIPDLASFVASSDRGIAIYELGGGDQAGFIPNMPDRPALQFAIDRLNSDIIVYDGEQSSIDIINAEDLRLIANATLDVLKPGSVSALAYDGHDAVALAVTDELIFPDNAVYENTGLVFYSLSNRQTSRLVLDDLIGFPAIATFVTFAMNAESAFILVNYPGYDWYEMWELDRTTGHLKQTVEAAYIVPAFAAHADVTALGLAFTLGITDDWEYRVEVSDLMSERVICSVPVEPNPYRPRFGRLDRISAVALTDDGTLLAIGDDEGKIKLWITDTCTHLTDFVAHQDKIAGLVFPENGKILLSVNAVTASQHIRAWTIEIDS
ncbi:MAG: hypothetical protein IPK19_29530 [Chloroflexi bacterium]|nr:hypothetical protein [Chloroflexota bacterium]